MMLINHNSMNIIPNIKTINSIILIINQIITNKKVKQIFQMNRTETHIKTQNRLTKALKIQRMQMWTY